jgi:hypothetical protein
MKMKWIAAVFLFAFAVVPSPSCQASGSEERDVKKPAQNISEKSRKTSVRHQSHIAMQHPERTGFCRDFYCKHSAGSPWWPGAPGD